MKSSVGNTNCPTSNDSQPKSPFSEKPPVIKLESGEGKAMEKKLAENVQRHLNQ